MAAIGASARVACSACPLRRYIIAGGAFWQPRAATYAANMRGLPVSRRLASSSARAAASNNAGELSFGWPTSEASFYAADVADTAAAAAAEDDPADGPFDSEFTCALGRPVEAENILETNQRTNEPNPDYRPLLK